MWVFGQSRNLRLGVQDTVFVDRLHHRYTNRVNSCQRKRIQKLSSELEQICANLQLSDLFHVRLLASIVGQIISLSASCGSVTQIMTRYLHIIINSRCSWNSRVFLSIQGKEELLFWKNNLRVLNAVVFWAPLFIPSKLVFSDTSSTGCAAFIQDSGLVFHTN